MNTNDFRQLVSSVDRFLDTCDGGDIGSAASPSTWLMGVEPGNSLADQMRKAQGIVRPCDVDESYPISLQLEWPFNRMAFKLLNAIEGGAPESYVEFARRVKPFVRGSRGYFKANLFPVPFNKLKTWNEEATQYTGFGSKEDYQAWVREVRFPLLSSQLELHRPKLLIATGMLHLQDFLRVAKSTSAKEHVFMINKSKKRMFVATDGLVPLVVLPHLSGGPNGLNSNAAVTHAATVILQEGMIRERA